jgi:hypothetical protein
VAALTALDDPKQFRNIDPAVRELLRGRAMLGRQKASFATVSAVEAGLVDGTKTHDDVDGLLKDGVIGQATLLAASARSALWRRPDSFIQIPRPALGPLFFPGAHS